MKHQKELSGRQKRYSLDDEAAVRAVLREAGLRCTQTRTAVLQVLLTADDPLTHDEVHERTPMPGINRVTIYRILESLTNAGIVHRIDAGDRVWRFAVCGRMHTGHCHPHFVCRVCGRIECLNECPMPRIPKQIANHQVEEQELYFRGLCAECAS